MENKIVLVYDSKYILINIFYTHRKNKCIINFKFETPFPF